MVLEVRGTVAGAEPDPARPVGSRDTGLLAGLDQLVEAARSHAATPTGSLSDDELLACQDLAHSASEALVALQTHLLHEVLSRGIPAAHGHRRAASWLRERHRIDPFPAKQLVGLARVLHRHPAIDDAVVAGLITTGQAAVIAEATANIPAEAGLEVRADAERALLGMAADYPPYKLRRLGERILTHVAPHLAEQAEARATADLEQTAHRARRFTLSLPTAGLVRLSGLLPQEDAEIVRAALDPLCRPLKDDDRTPRQRRADALTDICGRILRGGKLPESGNQPAQLTVTVGYDPLKRELTGGYTDTGTPISAATARRLACDTDVLPAFLTSDGQPLDLGRSHRLPNLRLRRAVILRDGGCTFPGCDRPARWCDAHHVIPWHKGGPTDLGNLALLCRHHHRLIDGDSGWLVRIAPDGRPEYLPPAHLDPSRRPRRNAFHFHASGGAPPAASLARPPNAA